VRRPTVADVLEAVTYVAGVDPLTPGDLRGRAVSKNVSRARRLACHSLRQITDCSFPEIGRALHYRDHSTAVHHCSQPVDYEELRAVAGEVSRIIEDEERALEVARWG
jgi:chromosomal replication initiation ATPase DnaA